MPLGHLLIAKIHEQIASPRSHNNESIDLIIGKAMRLGGNLSS